MRESAPQIAELAISILVWLATAIPTLLGAFGGAWFAFRLENQRRRREEENSRAASGNLALHTLLSMWNFLKQYQNENIKNYRDRNNRWLHIPASPVLPAEEMELNRKELSFLLDGSDKNYVEIFMEEQRYNISIKLIRRRTRTLINEVYNKMSDANIKFGSTVEAQEVERIIGIKTVHMLKNYTDAIVKNVDENVISLQRSFENLHHALERTLPDHKFLKVRFEKPDQQESPTTTTVDSHQQA